MQRWTPIAGCVGQAEGSHVTWADHCDEVEYQVDDMQKHACQMARERDEMMVERNNAEKREREALGRANALEVANKLAARMEADAQERADCLLAVLKDIGDFAHDRSTGPAVEDALWEVRRMAYEAMTPNAAMSGAEPASSAERPLDGTVMRKD